MIPEQPDAEETPTASDRRSPKANARLSRRALKVCRQTTRVESIPLGPSDIRALTGATLRQLAAWKRRGHIATIGVPQRIPRGQEKMQVNILGFRDLITVLIITHLRDGRLSEEVIFRRCSDNPRSRGLLARCEMALSQRHGMLEEHVLIIIRRKSELDVSVIKDPTTDQLDINDALIIDFRRIIPAMIELISNLKRRPIPVDYTLVGLPLPKQK